MTDLISRADAIKAVHKYFVDAFNNEPHEIDEDGDDVFTDMKSVNALLHHNKYVSKALKALPSADAEPTVIRSRTLLPTKDFKEWAKRIREVNPNAVVIPCDAEVVSANAVHGEWIKHKGEWINKGDYAECSICGAHTASQFDGVEIIPLKTKFCPNCGARMKGGAE